MPDVTRLLDACGVAWALISTKWFICLFCDVLPIEVSTSRALNMFALRTTANGTHFSNFVKYLH